jgi:hypothetical protein
MTTETKPTRKVVHTSSLAGAFWTAGWLFTISFANLIWWKSLLALIIWPYFIGLAVR